MYCSPLHDEERYVLIGEVGKVKVVIRGLSNQRTASEGDDNKGE